MQSLPPRPDFDALSEVAHRSADKRTLILALIGNLVFSWSNNESMLIYIIMLLMRTDETSAAIVFATLNTTRARMDLISRLMKAGLKDHDLGRRLDSILSRFNDCTRVRNEFNHCMYSVNTAGEITHTHAMRVQDTASGPRLGPVRPIDDRRIQEMADTVQALIRINREMWEILPVIEAHMKGS